jgi:hypothetical protein
MKPKHRKRGLNKIIAFGKYKGYTYKQVIDTDLTYIKWCLNTIPNFRLTEEAQEYFNERKKNDAYNGMVEDLRDIWADIEGDKCGDQ